MTPQEMQEALRRGAFHNTSRGLLRKLPLFLVAGLAVFILTRLDSAKTNYDISNDSAGSTSFVVDDSFIQRLPDTTDTTLKGWLSDPALFKYRKLSNRRTLLDALAETAVTDYEKQKSVLESKQKTLNDSLAKAKQEEVAQINVDLKEIDTKIQALTPALHKETSEIYTTFGKNLPGILGQNRSAGLFDQLLEPTLKEESSLHVVYQVFRVTALIIVVLTFVFIFVMAISQLPLASGTDTVSEQLKALISVGSAAGGGGIAKAAIVSLAALGVGTAVVVGGKALDGRSASAPSQSNVKLPGTSGDGYSRNAFFTEQNLNSLYLYRLMQTRIYDPQPWPEFNPVFEVPPPTVINHTVADTEGTREILNQLTLLVAKLRAPADLTSLQAQIITLQKMIEELSKKPDDCKCEAALKRIGDLIYYLNLSIGGPPSVPPILAPSTTPTSPPSPASTSSPVTSSSATPAASPTPSPTVLSNLNKTATALANIEKELKELTDGSRLRQRSDGRNLATRTGQLFGTEHYWVSEWAYQVLNEILNENSANAPFIDALEKMKGQAPQKKSTFLKDLRDKIISYESPADKLKSPADRVKSPADKKDLLDRLKPWEKVILNYARLPS